MSDAWWRTIDLTVYLAWEREEWSHQQEFYYDVWSKYTLVKHNNLCLDTLFGISNIGAL